MALLIQNGEIVTARERGLADIYCAGETITRIAPGLTPPPGTEVIDARGCYVFPGFIDPHVHLHLPARGMQTKDDFVSGSQAALAGGTTTVIEMCNPVRGDGALAGFERWMEAAAGKSACDFSFHMGVAQFDAATAAAVRGAAALVAAVSAERTPAIDLAGGEVNEPALSFGAQLDQRHEIGVGGVDHLERAGVVERRIAHGGEGDDDVGPSGNCVE